MMLTFLDVALGLTLLYAALAMFCSSVVEAISARIGLRGQYLRGGLLRVAGEEGLYRRLIHHPAIASTYRERPGTGNPPSYLASERFVSALLDVIPTRARAMGMPHDFMLPGDAAPDAEAANFARCAYYLQTQGVAVGAVLSRLADRNGTSAESFHKALAAWYDSQMERTGGWYKRRVQKLLFAIGLLVALPLNIDTVAITQRLTQDPGLRAWASAEAAKVAASGSVKDVDTQSALQSGLPIGYNCVLAHQQDLRTLVSSCSRDLHAQAFSDWLLKLVGLLLTAFAVSFGAPFWFQLLMKIVDLRGSGNAVGKDGAKKAG
ncbi:hypothetical protein [Niveibacterium sp. SC-1]|uniref:hypothetical protein n=1 Tax=Niveibacterium sp. SC-1 TaxID=3135646 RepID=UPI00311DBC94